MSEFTPTKKLTTEEQKELSADDQREYIMWRMKQEGEEVPSLEDGNYIIPTLGADQEVSPGALPPKEVVHTEPPGTQGEDDNSDLPASMRGELGSLDEVDPVIPPVETKEEVPAEKAAVPPGQETEEVVETEPATEEPPKEEEPAPFIKVNEQTAYKTEEEAIKGINEKDLTIQARDEELRIARQDAELAVREAESLRRRFDAETAAAAAQRR